MQHADNSGQSYDVYKLAIYSTKIPPDNKT